ncbi:cation-transporting P-type ATPase [Magnetospira sp. QH-2]|uniref:cation-transporting P-type ATPase n=1 Tax=Magnetospira sp. (strain QH-2) TaxID=1288970 RepID=UPI0003E813CC|nr:cation-transporting P-type ATPase [Magnetospira sp. QH-2]CCQ73010.1 putative cation-transporting ATPase [Magnetospira sp. QH-2]
MDGSDRQPNGLPPVRVPWHALDMGRVQQLLDCGPDGLSDLQAQERLTRFGPNQLPEARPVSAFVRFLRQFHNVLIYVLLAAAGMTAALEHWIDTGVIVAVVLINVIIGFLQEGKAEDALRAIRNMLSPQAMVLRDGRRTVIEARDLVPGDLVLLQSGDKVPADLRLLSGRELRLQEAVLTGESVAVSKTIEPRPEETVLADRRCMAYSGTLVTAGQGAGLVIATGKETEIGRISALVARVEQLTTPLLRQMAQFGRWLTAGILAITMFTFLFGVLVQGYSAVQMFLAGVGLAVAAIPEGLPAIMTITLAIGVQRMAKRNAIIRRLPAVETLGAVTTICSDKTGTLTCNEMTVRGLVTADGRFETSGTGYDPHGGFHADGTELLAPLDFALIQAAEAACLCNDASLEQKDGDWRVNGDPMEGALLVAGIKAGLEPDLLARQYPRTDLIPFESEHRFMATLHHSHAGEAFVFVKGAPERLLEMCRTQRTRDGDGLLDRDYWSRMTETLADSGQRVLAVAVQEVPGDRLELEFDDIDGDLVMLALFGLIDPPREEAVTAVGTCRGAGIRVKMITGDHALTARAIARQLDLAHADGALTGAELDDLDDEELSARLSQVDVFARVSPEHKLRLVSLMQGQGGIVAMTGDGVNDAPALKRADVGVAMGRNGTEAAKDAAEMVLADDNFASISHAVEEGRTVDDNIKKSILFILPTNGGEALTILAAVLFGFADLPLTPVQILWVNMITAVTLALALAFEPPEPHVMARPPREPDEPILTRLFIWRITYVSLILVTGVFGLYLWETAQGASLAEARTVAVNTLILFEIFYLFNSRSIIGPVLNRRGLLGSPVALYAVGLLIIIQIGFTYLGFMQTLFGVAAIGPETWLRIVLVASSVLFLVELEKALRRKSSRG